MARLIGTVGYYNHSTGHGFIHPDAEFLSHGINLVVSPDVLPGGPDSLRSSQRITCEASNGRASDIRPYGGQGEL